MGLNMLESFKNPKFIGQKGNTSYKAVLPGLTYMEQLMKDGKLKVHKNCINFWREFRKYNYNDKGEPSPKDNHWMDAARMAVMSQLKDLGEIENYSYHSQSDDYYINHY